MISVLSASSISPYEVRCVSLSPKIDNLYLFISFAIKADLSLFEHGPRVPHTHCDVDLWIVDVDGERRVVTSAGS